MRAMLGLVILVPTILGAQHGEGAQPFRPAPPEAKQFDFLLGKWELVVKPPVSGLAARLHGVPAMSGTWKAWRALDGWGITDELRISDQSGNPRALTQATRMYDASARRWTNSSADVFRGGFATSTSEWSAGAMVASTTGAGPDGKPYVTRTRYYEITPNSFRYRQERSTDGGKTWTRTLDIDAKRVAATAPR